MNVRFTLLPQTLAIVRLDGDATQPEWARGEFVSVTRTPGELSVVCDDGFVPDGVTAARGWRCLRAEGPFPLDVVGIAAAFLAPLAAAGIAIFLIATYDTDYLLIDGRNLPRAIDVLHAAGHTIGTSDRPA
jgi:hypothetical protein